MPDGLIRIRDWNDHFENNRTRGLREMKWVPIPNKMDGDGYMDLVNHENGAEHFAAWVAMVEVASRCKPRGILLRGDGKPHNSNTLARRTKLPERIFAGAIPRLLEIGWITQATVTGDVAGPCADPAPTCGETAGPRREGAPIPHRPDIEGRKEGRKEQREPPAIDPDSLATNPAFRNVDTRALLAALTREKVPEDRVKDVLSVVERSLSARRPPPAGVKDSPTGYALKVLESKAAEIRDAALADKAARRDGNSAHFNGADFTAEEKDELVEKYRKILPGITVVFDNDIQPFEADPEPPSSPKPAKTPPPAKDESPPPGDDGRPAPYHLLKEFPSLWDLDNRAQIIGALVDLPATDRLPALRYAMEMTRGPHPGETTLEEVVLRAVSGGFRPQDPEAGKTEEPVHATDALEDTDETS